MIKQLMVVMLLLMIVPLASADLGTFRQGDCVNIKTILNTTAVNISTLSYPNTTIALTNVAMTKLGSTFNYSFCNTEPLGIYTYDYFDIEGNVYVNSFTITKNGYELPGDNFTIMLYILFIVAVVGTFVTFILTIAKLATTSETIFGVLTTWSFYILLILVNYLSSYQLDSYITNLSSTFITITTWSNGVLPLISFVIAFFVRGTQQAKPLSVDNVTGGGFRYG